MKVTIDTKKNEATIVVPINPTLRKSATGATEALFLANNQDTGLTHTDGRPIKASINLYVKPAK